MSSNTSHGMCCALLCWQNVPPPPVPLQALRAHQTLLPPALICPAAEKHRGDAMQVFLQASSSGRLAAKAAHAVAIVQGGAPCYLA